MTINNNLLGIQEQTPKITKKGKDYDFLEPVFRKRLFTHLACTSIYFAEK